MTSPHSRSGILLCASVLLAGCEDPRAITSAEGEMGVVVDGNNQLALHLYDFAADEQSGNLLFSPFSIATALSMLYAGAESTTELQIAGGLGVDGEDAWHANLGALADDLTGQHYRPYTLHAAHQVWSQDGVDLLAPFVDTLEDDYLAEIEVDDFAYDPGAARKRINRWVKTRTKGHVSELFEKADITAFTRVVLVNAIYFQGDWEHRFRKQDTADLQFTFDDGSKARVPMMYQGDEQFGIMETDDVQVLELPYEGGDLAMVVVLPRLPAVLADVERDLTLARIDGWLDALEVQPTEVWLPTFELDRELPLPDALTWLGMTEMFDPDLADLTGIARADQMMDNYYVAAARHRAFVAVHERGTTAAAASGVAVADRSSDPDLAVFRADHPFLFLIRDRLTGAILFMGRVEDPRG